MDVRAQSVMAPLQDALTVSDHANLAVDDSEQSDSEQSEDTVPVISSTSDRNDNINTDTDSDDMESENK